MYSGFGYRTSEHFEICNTLFLFFLKPIYYKWSRTSEHFEICDALFLCFTKPIHYKWSRTNEHFEICNALFLFFSKPIYYKWSRTLVNILKSVMHYSCFFHEPIYYKWSRTSEHFDNFHARWESTFRFQKYLFLIKIISRTFRNKNHIEGVT